MGWRRGCLDEGLVRSTVCYYCLGGCSALGVRGARGRARGSGPVPVLAPPFPCVPRSACGGLSRPVVASLHLPVRSSMRSVRSAGSVRLRFESAPRVRWVWMRWCSRGVRASSPLQVGVVRALRAVRVQGTCRAVPGGSCPSLFPDPVPCSAFFALGGWPGPFIPSPGLGSLAPLRAGLPLRAGFARCKGGWRAPGEGYLLLGCGASGAGRSPQPDRLSLGRVVGARYPLAVGAGGLGVQTRHQPHSVPSCELALRTVEAAPGRPGGGGATCLAVVCPGFGAVPRPTDRPMGVQPGPSTHLLGVEGVWAWGPVTNPTACDLASWLGALWGRHEGARGGGAALACVWGVQDGALSYAPPPVLAACSRGSLPTRCACGGRRRGDKSPTPQRALSRAGFARFGGGTRAPPAWV